MIDDKLIKEITDWASKHPNPDEPLLVIGYDSYSPKQILDEVMQGTTLGSRLIEEYRKYSKPSKSPDSIEVR